MSETECTSPPVTELIRTEIRGQRMPEPSSPTPSESGPITIEEASQPENNLIEQPTDRRKTLPHLFKPGQSGNPAGRPKGSKTRVQVLKQSLEAQLREAAGPRMLQVLNKAIDLALAGDRLMLKVLLEFHISKNQHEDSPGGDKSKVTLVVQNLTGSPREIDITPPGVVIEGNQEDE